MSIRLPNNVIAFAKDNIKPYEQFVDYFNHFYKKGTYDESVSLSEKEDKLNTAVRSEIARLSNLPTVDGIAPEVLATHPAYAWATFAVIGSMVDAVLPQALIDSVGLYTDVRTGGYGDSFAFDIKPRDLFVVSKAGKGKRNSEIHKQFDGQVTIIPEFRDITVGVSFYKVLAGKENLAEFAMKAAKSLESQATIDAFNAFNTAMGALDNAGDDLLRVAGYSQTTLVSLCQKVTAWNGGNKAVVVGTQLALQDILPNDANYRYDLDSQYVKIGYIPTAFNYDLMALPQVASYTNPFTLALDDTKIYILSPSAPKILKMCLEGSTISITNGTFDNANLTQNTTMKKSYGVGVGTSSIAAVITLS
jgi:hypothetical protein